MPLTTTMANAVLNKIFRGVDFTGYGTVYLALHTANPGDAGSSEVTGGSYARAALSLAAAASRSMSNNALVDFVSMPACTVTHVSLWSAASGGTLLWYSLSIGASIVCAAGDTCRMPISALTFTQN